MTSKNIFKKNPKGKNLYLTVYNHIKKYNKLPKLGISKQRLNYYVRRLIREGYVEKIGYATYKKVKRSLGTHTPQHPKRIRGHGFQFTIKLPNISNWNNRQSYLDKKDIRWIPIGNNWVGQRIVYKDHKVWLTNKSLVIWTPKDKSYFGSTAKESKKYAFYDIQVFLKSLFKYLSFPNISYSIKFSKQHYAEIKNELAKQYNRTGKKLRVKGFDGEWLLIDKSLNVDELECIHPTSSPQDMDKVVTPFFEDLRNSRPPLPSQIQEYINKTQEQLNMLAQLQANNNKQLEVLISYLKPVDVDQKKIPEYFG